MDMKDLRTAFGRSVAESRPTSRTVSGFFGEELLASAVGWTAGSFSVWLVDQWFVVKSWRNLWGLTATRRTAVSADEYSLLGDIVGYTVGLAVLILVRQIIIGTLRHYQLVRQARIEDGGLS